MDALTRLPQEVLIAGIDFLDATPDAVRAMLAACLLVAFLTVFEARVPPKEIQYGQSFRKTALVVLLLLPLLIWLFPASRMIVFVEELAPRPPPGHWLWTTLISVWLVGAMVSLGALLYRWRRAAAELGRFPAVSDEKLVRRLAHWQGRLGLNRPVVLLECPGEQPLFLRSERHVLLPAAARHWPTNQQDVVLINGLCRLQRRHRRWHLSGQVITCVYWPVSRVQRLHANLLWDLQQGADQLAESCYQDRVGYERTLRQLAQRLAPLPSARRSNGNATGTGRPAPLANALRRYATYLTRLLEPPLEPGWRLDELLARRAEDNKPRWTDPYDRVVVSAGLSAFLAFLLTGVTLAEQPPEIEENYQLPFELFWKEHFHRNLELQEKAQPQSGSSG